MNMDEEEKKERARIVAEIDEIQMKREREMGEYSDVDDEVLGDTWKENGKPDTPAAPGFAWFKVELNHDGMIEGWVQAVDEKSVREWAKEEDWEWGAISDLSVQVKEIPKSRTASVDRDGVEIIQPGPGQQQLA